MIRPNGPSRIDLPRIRRYEKYRPPFPARYASALSILGLFLFRAAGRAASALRTPPSKPEGVEVHALIAGARGSRGGFRHLVAERRRFAAAERLTKAEKGRLHIPDSFSNHRNTLSFDARGGTVNLNFA